jgi:hypothetical protein
MTVTANLPVLSSYRVSCTLRFTGPPCVAATNPRAQIGVVSREPFLSSSVPGAVRLPPAPFASTCPESWPNPMVPLATTMKKSLGTAISVVSVYSSFDAAMLSRTTLT